MDYLFILLPFVILPASVIGLFAASRAVMWSPPTAVRATLSLVLEVFGWILLIVMFAWGTLVFLLGLGLVIFCLLARNWFRRRELLLVLATATEQSSPLAPAVEGLAREHRNWFGYKLWRLAQRLRSGKSLSEAFGTRPSWILRWAFFHTTGEFLGLLPKHYIALIAAGEQSGMLPDVLRMALVGDRATSTLAQQYLGRLVYLMYPVWFVPPILLFWGVKIEPSLAKIFEEFGVAATEGLHSSARLQAAIWIGDVLMIVGLLVLLQAFLWCSARVRFPLPGTGRVFRRLDGAAVMRCLALAARKQLPLEKVLAVLAVWFPGRAVRRRLALAGAEAQCGVDCFEALARQRVIERSDLAVLRAAEQAGNVAWALEEQAEGAQRRMLYRLNWAMQIVFPVMVVVIGAMILIMVVNNYLPLARLITGLFKSLFSG